MHCFRIQIDLACHVRESLVPNEVSQLCAALEAPFRPPVALGLLWEKKLSVAATLQTRQARLEFAIGFFLVEKFQIDEV